MSTKNSIYKHVDFLIIDELCLLIGFLVSYAQRISPLKTLPDSLPYKMLLIIVLAVGVVVTFFTQTHRNNLRRGFADELRSVVLFELWSYILLALVLYITRSSITFSRLMIGFTYVYVLIFSYIFRLLWKYILKKRSVASIANSNNKMLVITDHKNLEGTIKKINTYNYEMNEIIGLCVLDKDMKGECIDKYTIVANKDDVMAYICVNWVDEVYFAMDYSRIPQEMIKGLAVAGVTTNIRLSKIADLEGREQTVQ